jgi:hypothetical protein
VNNSNKIYSIVILLGAVSGALIGYIINTGLNNAGLDNLIYWVGGGIVIALLRVKVSPAIKHLFRSK